MATLFEAPLANPEFEFENVNEWGSPEASLYNPEFEFENVNEWGSPEASVYNPEFEFENVNEWGSPEASVYNPEFEFENVNEWGSPEASVYNPEFEFENVNEWGSPEASVYNPEFEFEFENVNEWGSPEASVYNPEFEFENVNEWGSPEASVYNPEFEFENVNEWEADPFIGRALRRGIGRLGSIAKRMAPAVVGKLAGMIPGAGLIAGPLASQLTRALVREGEMETLEMEAHLFGTSEANPEVGTHESSQEAALTELMAAEAATASGEAEAVSALSASLPITIMVMGGRRGVRRVMPALTQANAALVRSLMNQGRAGRQLLRAVPSIQRQTVATLRAANRRGRPVTNPAAVRAMAAATSNVLNNPSRVATIVQRNQSLRRQVAPSPRQGPVRMSSSPYRQEVHAPNPYDRI